MAFDQTRVDAIVGTNTSDSQKLAIIIDLLQTAGIVTPATPAGENVIGALVGKSVSVDLAFSLDTSAYADGDLLADTQSLGATVFRVAAGISHLESIVLRDDDDQKGALDLVFLNANQSMGSENSAPNISDANALKIIGHVSISAADWKDMGGVSVATLRGIGLSLKAAAASTTLWVALISRDAKTYTAAGLNGTFNFIQD